jgi:AraC-like DNA-binding protein
MSRISTAPAERWLAEAGWEERRSGLITPVLPADPAVLSTFNIINVLDPREMEDSSRPPNDGAEWRYRLQDRGLMRANFDSPITSIAERYLGSLMIAHGGDRFATQVDIGGDGIDAFCFTAMFHGRVTLIQHGKETTGIGANGLVFRGTPGTRILTSDVNARQSLWIEASGLEDALEFMLESRLGERLAFKPGIDWTSGLAASLRGQIDFLIGEIKRQGGVADNPVALASLTDLVVSLVLRGIPHNYLDRLERGPFGAVPAYVRRAEEFMRANAAAPIRLEHVAAAAGCSIRTLNAVFRQFRDTTPLTALHKVRLEQVRAELSQSVTAASIGGIARRYGFTNPGRFAAAYRRRFGEAPSETARRGAR